MPGHSRDAQVTHKFLNAHESVHAQPQNVCTKSCCGNADSCAPTFSRSNMIQVDVQQSKKQILQTPAQNYVAKCLATPATPNWLTQNSESVWKCECTSNKCLHNSCRGNAQWTQSFPNDEDAHIVRNNKSVRCRFYRCQKQRMRHLGLNENVFQKTRYSKYLRWILSRNAWPLARRPTDTSFWMRMKV